MSRQTALELQLNTVDRVPPLGGRHIKMEDSTVVRETHSNDHDLRIEVHAGDYPLTRAERDWIESEAEALSRLIAGFPRTDLKIELTRNRGSVRASAALWLGGRMLFASDSKDLLSPAVTNCIQALVRDVTAYKHKMSNKPAYGKEREGTVHRIEPSMDPDLKPIGEAVENLDYPTFRQLMSVYEDGVEKRVGRWIERSPQAESMVGTDFNISDVVEAVFLNAFEKYDQRPSVPMGPWLEDLVSTTIKAMTERPEEERENARFAATSLDANLAALPPVPSPQAKDLPPPTSISQ
jgi:ribosome-associated translation inhibitor RaiA